MKAILTYCSILLSIQLSFAHSLFPQSDEITQNSKDDLNVSIELSIYDWYSDNASGTTICITYNQYLSCRYFANNNLLAPKYEHVQLTNEQKQKIHEFVKPIFLNSFMYINRLTDPNTYSDNAYVVQLRINGLLYFETFGLPDKTHGDGVRRQRVVLSGFFGISHAKRNVRPGKRLFRRGTARSLVGGSGNALFPDGSSGQRAAGCRRRRFGDRTERLLSLRQGVGTTRHADIG